MIVAAWAVRAVRALWRSGPPAILAIATVGGAFGVLTIFGGLSPVEANEFTSTGEYRLWIFLLTLQTALWALALIPFAASLKMLWRYGSGHWLRVGAIVFTLALPLGAFIAVTWMNPLEYPLPNHEWKLRTIAIAGSIVALVGALAMALVHEGLAKLEEADLGSEWRAGTAIRNYLLLREHLQRLLAVEGAIIGAAVLATAAQRNAILVYGDKVLDAPWDFPGIEAPTFPPQHVLIYGAAFSVLLALLWGPIYARQVAVGARLRSNAVGEAPATDESWPDWHERRRKMDGVLGLEASALATFRTSVAILTPLASGLLGLLFEL